FRKEAEAVARLVHPNIVQIFDVGEHANCPYLALEFVEGLSLARQLAQGVLAADRAAALVETLARAMHAAHEQGIVPRDLRPATVLLAFSGRPQGGAAAAPLGERPLDDGIPKITDFGLAKLNNAPSGASGPGRDEARTATGALVGTPSYMAPEQAAGQK